MNRARIYRLQYEHLPRCSHNIYSGYNRAMNNKEVREKLIDIGADRLADALLYLASRFDEVDEYVEALLLSSEEAAARFRRKLAGLKRRRKFIDWRAAPDFARELEMMLAALPQTVIDPKMGLELVAEFVACDRAVFQRCDDSDGIIGDVFRYDACKLFTHYASACTDKPFISDLVFRLYAHDDYGVREGLLDETVKFLPEEELHALAQRFWDQAKSELSGSFAADHWWLGVEALARRLGDASLFEKARLNLSSDLTSAACMDIAEVYLETGDPEMALFWMKHIPPDDRFRADEQDRLLYSIHEQLGNREEMREVAWRLFRNYRSKERLSMLLRALGESERARVIEAEVRKIREEEELSYRDAAFLIELGRLDDAEDYLCRYRDQLDGDAYTSLLPLAKALEEGGHPLGATVVYRALLESILRRAQSRYYHHGVRYLKKLDALAPAVVDWRGIIPHAEYKQKLIDAHGRKRSFWSKYEG